MTQWISTKADVSQKGLHLQNSSKQKLESHTSLNGQSDPLSLHSQTQARLVCHSQLQPMSLDANNDSVEWKPPLSCGNLTGPPNSGSLITWKTWVLLIVASTSYHPRTSHNRTPAVKFNTGDLSVVKSNFTWWHQIYENHPGDMLDRQDKSIVVCIGPAHKATNSWTWVEEEDHPAKTVQNRQSRIGRMINLKAHHNQLVFCH